jgi:hypothetical protein
MSARITKLKRANFNAEVAFAATVLLTMASAICALIFDGGKFGGPWTFVAGTFAALVLLTCAYGFAVSTAARKEGIRHLPKLGDYLDGHRD